MNQDKGFVFEKGLNESEFLIFGDNIRVHPHAEIKSGAIIGKETLILNCIIGKSQIGEDCIVGHFTLIEDDVEIGDETKIWHYNHIRKGVKIGDNCVLGDYVFIDSGVIIGEGTKIQNYVPVYHGVELEEGVFLGPNSLTTNDLIPRARSEEGELKNNEDWTVSAIYIGKDASIGAGAVLKPGIRIGEKALVGAGAVVTKDVPAGAVVVGNPAKILRYVDGYQPE